MYSTSRHSLIYFQEEEEEEEEEEATHLYQALSCSDQIGPLATETVGIQTQDSSILDQIILTHHRRAGLVAVPGTL
jgi:hypothetical protein